MTSSAALDRYGRLTEPTTLTIERRLPGPVERVWAHLTDSDLRRRWLAAGDMPAETGVPFELVWRNDELTGSAGERPDGFSEEHRMTSHLTVFDPPHRLAFTWGEEGNVTFTLEPDGTAVLLTVVHRGLVARSARLNVGSGWHTHLDVLAARLENTPLQPFWPSWKAIRAEYDRRLPD